MISSLIIAAVIVFVLVLVLAFLVKVALRVTLGITLAALLIFSGIYVFTGKAGLGTAAGITGATITDIKDSEAVQDITGAVKETTGEIIDAGKEKAIEIMNESEET
jgi:hypothetical protein